MAERGNSLSEVSIKNASNLDFAPMNYRQSLEIMQPTGHGNIEKLLEDYSAQLIELLASDIDCDSTEALDSDLSDSSRISDIVQQKLERREKIEMLFVEMSRKMWRGQLPAISVAIVERQYRDSTGRLLNEDLKDEQWSAYFSAFQLSLDILNGRT